ncbi:sensor histidine kinase [Lacibacter luteus]|uniref:histidine kinase n=1 Tax=Lacibacter luteus TaxID=2508719 RepID=A0A4Q1CDG7_9BACT|nr:sensor histidine kinase [Lacibacter luteus]RXK57605.1 sensor histidine kinase [Lacibacter luteus]
MKQYWLLILLCFVSLTKSFAHEDTSLSVIYTSAVKNLHYLDKNMHVFIDSNNNTDLQILRGIMFMHLNEKPKRRVAKQYMIDSKVYLLFWIKNDEDKPRDFFITPGIYAKECILYTRLNNDYPWKELPGQVVPDKNENAYRYFTVQPGTEMQILVSCRYARTNVILFKPYLINPIYLDDHISNNHNEWYGVNVFTYLLCGLLLMMMLYSFANYVQNLKRSFLYYSIYALLIGSLLFLKAALHERSTPFNFFYEEYLDYFLQISGYVFYIGFTRMFLNTPKQYPTLNKMFVIAEIALVVFLAVFSILYFTGSAYPNLVAVENSSKYFLIFLGIMYLILGIVKRNKLMNYLLAGNISNLLFGGMSQYLISNPSSNLFPDAPLFRQSLIYFELGVFLELIFFLLGLVYKNKIELIEKVKMDEAMKLEAEKQEYAKQLAVLSAQQDERSRISADMHDELGSGVTAIRLLSEIARKKTKDRPVEEIDRISYNANELMTKMNAIIWSMNPGNDTVDSLVAYIRSYASEYLDNFDMLYRINTPVDLPKLEVSGVKRRNIFLVLKESINNVMKHSGATEVTVDVHFTDRNQLIVEIADNGKGIDAEKLNQFGNGLKNMKRRMESIGGSFNISATNGTRVILEVPL